MVPDSEPTLSSLERKNGEGRIRNPGSARFLPFHLHFFPGMRRDSVAYFYFLFASRLVYKPRLAIKLAHIKITTFPLSVCSIYLISSRLYDDILLFISSSSFPSSHLISLKACIFPFFASRTLFIKVVIKEKIKVHYIPRTGMQKSLDMKLRSSVYNEGGITDGVSRRSVERTFRRTYR